MAKYSFKTSLGYITIVEENNFITEILFKKSDTSIALSVNMLKAKTEIEEYILGTRKKFDFEYKINGTEFELKVLEAMKSIPYGELLSYSELSKKAGFPKAARATGSVCRKNKLPFLYPCHRVIRSDGSFGNYAGGIDIKAYLITMEKNRK